ncbi:hypothetical protein N7488_003700 [Penicillium malachiteum]|nr:hypothetical protein N7488_003700 [Penicillium malachiteum]
MIQAQWGQEWKTSAKGAHIRMIDVKLLYQVHQEAIRRSTAEPRDSAVTAAHSYQKKTGYSDDDWSEYGSQKTVVHVLMECPKLRELRVELRRKADFGRKRFTACQVGFEAL